MRPFALFLLLCAAPVQAGPLDSIAVGVFLPTTVADGQQRFDFGEKLAAALGSATGAKTSARNYARYADFMDAVKSGKIDVAVVDAWIAAESGESMPPVALASIGGATKRRWVVVAKGGKSMSVVLGKPLALTRGAGNADGNFVTNAIFEGALVADKAMKLTYAPSVESALRMWSLGTTEAALVPSSLAPADAKVLYQSSPLPIAVVLAAKSKVEAIKKAIAGVGAIAPFDGFHSAGVDEVGALRKLVSSGPPPKAPVWAESPPVPLEAKGLVTFKGLQPSFPSLLDLVSVSKEMPDD
jgi:hypothetical protein